MRFLPILAVFACLSVGFSQTAHQQPRPGAPLPMQGSEDKTVLPRLEKAFNAAKAALAKKPKDKKLQAAFVSAGVKYGHESMLSPVLMPRVKYGQALRIYREVLKIEPNNSVAKPESDMIIGIYKQMGRPIPK